MSQAIFAKASSVKCDCISDAHFMPNASSHE